MKITSPAFTNKSKIPSKYTCDGKNISPPLNIEEIPPESKSLVLIMDDPDVPKFVREDGMWDHWIVFNIPSNTKKIPENKNPEGILGKNTSGKNKYTGPCPPDKEHRYFFKLYALDGFLELPEGSSKKDVESAMQGHIIEKAELVGTYNKK